MARLRILLADDHTAIIDRVAQLLSTDYDVVGTARDGQSLIEAAAATEPDLIILDISMPILSGIEAATHLKKIGSKAKIIFLTVHEDPDYINTSLDTGALGYVIKSRVASDLPLAIESALNGQCFISCSTNLRKFS